MSTYNIYGYNYLNELKNIASHMQNFSAIQSASGAKGKSGHPEIKTIGEKSGGKQKDGVNSASRRSPSQPLSNIPSHHGDRNNLRETLR